MYKRGPSWGEGSPGAGTQDGCRQSGTGGVPTAQRGWFMAEEALPADWRPGRISRVLCTSPLVWFVFPTAQVAIVCRPARLFLDAAGTQAAKVLWLFWSPGWLRAEPAVPHLRLHGSRASPLPFCEDGPREGPVHEPCPDPANRRPLSTFLAQLATRPGTKVRLTVVLKTRSGGYYRVPHISDEKAEA